MNGDSKDKYNDLDTTMKVKEVTKGLNGLNTGNKKKRFSNYF